MPHSPCVIIDGVGTTLKFGFAESLSVRIVVREMKPIRFMLCMNFGQGPGFSKAEIPHPLHERHFLRHRKNRGEKQF